MADPIRRTTRSIQAYSPLPDDVLPKIMLRVEDSQDFKRLACTCHGFYAWSEPWLKSRRQAAGLNLHPQRLTKVPVWIETHSRHLHPADWDAIQRWDIADENRNLPDQFRRLVAFNNAALSQPGPSSSATAFNAAHLDFILFSPRLLPNVNEEVASRANERLAANAYFALAGFHPNGEAWEYDVLAGAVAWLKENAATIDFDARSSLLSNLTWAMLSVMSNQHSPSLAIHLLKHDLSKSHHVFASDTLWHMQTLMIARHSPSLAKQALGQKLSKSQYASVLQSLAHPEKRWEDPLLTALVLAARYCKCKAGSPEATSFLGAIHQVISRLARMNESAALSVLVKRLENVMQLMSEVTWTPGSTQSAWLYALVQAVCDMPEALADIRNTLIEQGFITQDTWNALLQPEPVAAE
jgi:hypothetical protein